MGGRLQWKQALGDLTGALTLAVLAAGVLRLPFLTVDGTRVLWMGGAIVVGVFVVLPLRRWPIYAVTFSVWLVIGQLQVGWPAPAALGRLLVDWVVVLGSVLILRRTSWLSMQDARNVAGVTGVGLVAGLVRAGGYELLAWGSPATAVQAAAVPSLVVLSTLLGLLTAAPLVELVFSRPFAGMDRRKVIGILTRAGAALGLLALILFLAGPVFASIRIGVLQFAVFAYAALALPAVMLAGLLTVTAIASVGIAVVYLSPVGEGTGVSGLTLEASALIVLPVVGLALMTWILHAVRENERRTTRRITSIMDSLLDPHVLMVPVRGSSGEIVDFIYADVNDAACEDHGLPREKLVGIPFSELLPSEVAAGMVQRYARVVATGEPLILDGIALVDDTRDGATRDYDLLGVRIDDGVLLSWRDVTQRQADARALAASEERYRLLAENTMDLVLYLDPNGTISWASPSAKSVLGYDADELVGMSGRSLMEGDGIDLVPDRTGAVPAEGSAFSRVRLHARHGVPRWFEATARALHDEDGQILGVTVGCRDIDAEVQAEEALRREMSIDSLTGLSRSWLAVERIQGILDARGHPPWALLVAGVDGLGAINTAFGYPGGDAVLKVVAERVTAAVGTQDRVARIAGDEFAIMLEEVDSADGAAAEAERILGAVRGPVQVSGASVDVSVSIGIAMAFGPDADGLLSDATAAMLQATAKGPGSWELLDGDAGAESRKALAVRQQVREALDHGRMHAWFMPVVDLNGEAVVGYEALARWEDEDGLVRPPADFLRAAESGGLIPAIDRTILSQAIAALVTLPADRHIAVNVSGATLMAGDLVQRIDRELQQHRVDPGRLHLEVTETALLRVSPAVGTQMEELARLGVTWWLDDFGTGFSSISHLRDLPIGGLKLDRSFTAAVAAGHQRAQRLTEGLAALAHGLGLATVAEGVETDEQANLLRAQGWEMGQGWLYGQPAPPSVLLRHA